LQITVDISLQYLPRHIVRAAIEVKESLIVQCEESLSLTKCKIVTSTRYNHDEEKHLTTGWYKIIHENNINVGDKLVFKFN
jgi:hypothetical protein